MLHPVKRNKNMPLTQEQLIDHLGGMTVMEMTTLTHELEDRWGVSATPQLAQTTGGPNPEIPVEDQTEFDVVLESFGEKKINAIKVLRTIVSLGLKEAKEMVESAPVTIKEAISKEECEEIKAKLEEGGATVSIK
jgi:large subunit ribosomal protein L7/L12